MTLETVRTICRALPGVTEDVKWGHDLCFSVGKKMFTAVDLEPPHEIAFKCTPERFAELVERPGIIPAPYAAKNMWVMEQELGETLDRKELSALIQQSYDLVVAKLPKSKRPGAVPGRRGARRVRGKFTSLGVTAAFRTFVLDQLEELGDVTPRAMFGGVGLYHRGFFFGLLARDTLYLKVGDANRADYEARRMETFSPYPGRKSKGTTKYRAVPLDVLESALELAAWARKAIAIARSRPL